MGFIGSSTKLNNFKDYISPNMIYSHLGNIGGNITLEIGVITTAHVTGDYTLTLPTIEDITKQYVCIFDFTTTNTGYPSITNSNIKWKDSTAGVYSNVTSTAVNISGATNTSPIEITATSHEYQTGDVVLISSVGGNTAANGSWTITRTGVDTYTLNNSTGNGAYTGGGASIKYALRNRLTFISNNGSDNWEVKLEKFGGIITTFSQPTLSANGTLGGGSFAVYSNSELGGFESYKGVDGDSSTNWLGYGTSGFYYIWYTPNAVKVSSIDITNRTIDNQAITGYTIYGSNDNSDYTTIYSGTNSNVTASSSWTITIPTANQGFYKYYKLYVSSGNAGNVGFCQGTLNGVYIIS